MKANWFLLPLLALALLPTGTPEMAKAGYVQSGPDAYTSEDDPADTETSTKIEYTNVDSDAETWGWCSCSVYSRAWVKAVNSATADASAAGYWEISWEWEGPPSTPAGGTLSWSIAAGGDADAWGGTDPGDGGSAYSYADADSCAWIARTGGTFSGGANAYGSVEDDEMASGDAVVYPSATVVGTPTKDRDFGSYDLFIDWDLNGSDDDTVASGTSYVQVLAGAACDSYAIATAGGSGSGAEASATAYTIADAWPDATFESN